MNTQWPFGQQGSGIDTSGKTKGSDRSGETFKVEY
jgi:hypothetical protein